MATTFTDKINYLNAQARYYYVESRNIYFDTQNKFGIEVGLIDDYTSLLQQHWEANNFVNKLEVDGVEDKEMVYFEMDLHLKKMEKDPDYLQNESIEELARLQPLIERFLNYNNQEKISQLIFAKIPANKLLLAPYAPIINKYSGYDENHPLYPQYNIALNKVTVQLLSQYHTTCKLADVCQVVSRPFVPKPTVEYSIIGFEDIELETLGIVGTQKAIGANLQNSNWNVLAENDIVLVKRVGFNVKANIITKKQAGTLASSDIVLLNTIGINEASLLLLFQQYQFIDIVDGLQDYSINAQALLRVSIPIPSADIQQYFADRLQAYLLLYEKQKILDSFIEEANAVKEKQGEKAALYYLELNGF
jgi:hypothetical protein